MSKSANSEAHFSETRSERILAQFLEDFGTILGGLGAPKLEKRRSKKDVKKGVAKKVTRGRGARPIPRDAGQGGPYRGSLWPLARTSAGAGRAVRKRGISQFPPGRVGGSELQAASEERSGERFAPTSSSVWPR